MIPPKTSAAITASTAITRTQLMMLLDGDLPKISADVPHLRDLPISTNTRRLP